MRRSCTILVLLGVLGWCNLAWGEELTGKLVARRGTNVTIAPDDGAAKPEAGAKATLSKHFVKDLGFLKTQGWLEIASVTVKDAGKKIVLTIVEEKSKMTVNGKPVNHFKAGAKVKLVWGK